MDCNKQNKQRVSVKLIPYYIKGEDLFFLLGYSDKYKEWSFLGGTCESNDTLFNCLKREIEEESRLILDISNLNLKNCIRFSFKNKLLNFELTTIFYFLKIEENLSEDQSDTKYLKDLKNNLGTLYSTYRNKLVEDKIKNILEESRSDSKRKYDSKREYDYIKKSFNEVDKLSFFNIKGNEWYRMFYDSLIYFQKDSLSVSATDKCWMEELKSAYKTLIEFYNIKREEKYEELTEVRKREKIDPRILDGLIRLCKNYQREDVNAILEISYILFKVLKDSIYILKI